MSTTYTIICAILGETTEFSIKIASNEIVDQLKDMIKEKKPNRFARVDADDLTLYRVNISGSREARTQELKKLAEDFGERTELDPLCKLTKIYSTAPPEESIHIIVRPPQSGLERSPSDEASDVLTPLAQRDITSRLVAKWSRPSPALNLQSLHAYLRRPLAEDEKIPISQLMFDYLSRKSDFPEHELGAEQLATLFRVSEEVAPRAAGIFVSTIESVPPASGTEDVFHGTWDINIKNILSLILSNMEPIRNSNRNTSTGLQRPDSGFLVKGSCLVRGEEKGSNSGGDPQRELLDKLIWTYSPLPYILGYYAITTKVDFVAITAPPSTKTVPLFNHDLKFKNERVANLVHLIRFSQVVAQLGEKVHNRDRPEFVDFERDGGLVRMSIAGVVRKEFRHPDAVARVSKLIGIYELLKRKKVPNVDKLDRFNIQGNYPYVELSPVGHDTFPASGSESLNAVVCVLEALKVMHSSPNPVYHRDIREPNIIKSFDGAGWLLIDWSDASMAPTHAVTHLKESEHSPRVRQDNHGAEVDIWGVGRYLESLAYRVTCGIAQPDAVQQMARRWITDLATSAVAALDEINANKDLFTTRSSD